MATIKKASTGDLIKKVIKGVANTAPKKPMSLAKKVKEAKFQKNKGKFGMEGENVTLKDFSKKELSKKFGPPVDYTPKSTRPMLTNDQKANNAKILQEIKDGKRKNGGLTKAQSGVRIPKQLQQQGKPDARNSGLAIDTTSIPKVPKKLPGKSISSPGYKPSQKKYKTGGSIPKAKSGSKVKKAQTGGYTFPKAPDEGKFLIGETGPMRKTKVKQRSDSGDYVTKTVTRERKGAKNVSTKTRRTLQGFMNHAPKVSELKRNGGKMKTCKGGC